MKFDYQILYEEMTQQSNENYKLLCDTLEKLNKLEEQLGLQKTTYEEV